MVDPFFFAIPFFGLLMALAAVVLTVYVLYDIIFVQEMETIQKLIWIIIVLFLNMLGVLLYLVLVKYLDEDPLTDVVDSFGEDRKLRELDKLADLKDRGALTKKEFDAEKRKILGDED